MNADQWLQKVDDQIHALDKLECVGADDLALVCDIIFIDDLPNLPEPHISQDEEDNTILSMTNGLKNLDLVFDDYGHIHAYWGEADTFREDKCYHMFEWEITESLFRWLVTE